MHVNMNMNKCVGVHEYIGVNMCLNMYVNICVHAVGYGHNIFNEKSVHLIYIFQIGRAECVRCPWLLAQTKVATILGIFPLLVVFLAALL